MSEVQSFPFIFLKNIYLFVFGCTGSLLLHVLSLDTHEGFSLCWLFLFQNKGSSAQGFSNCGAWV